MLTNQGTTRPEAGPGLSRDHGDPGGRIEVHGAAATSDLPTGHQDLPMLEVLNATHRYGEVTALDNVTVTAAPGEFLTILGESGSGKTTLLRIISGLERPTEVGALKIAGHDVLEVPPSLRNCTTVFQSYALFPHMNVGENVAYGLKVRGMAPAERRERALQALALVRLVGKDDRRIHQLSGGERQRVALARALVTQPAILLLDEPLGALDEKLRLDMQVELLHLHKQLGMTVVYITHSQEEALTMSARVILMRRGRIAQSGPPRDLFDRPVSRFVAEFMGVDNIFEGQIAVVAGDRASVRIGDLLLSGIWSDSALPAIGEKVTVGVRAERVKLGSAPAAEVAGVNRVPVRPVEAIYKGKYLDQTFDSALGQVRVRLWDGDDASGSANHIWWRASDCMVMRV